VLVGVVCVFLYLGVALATIGPLQARGLALANAVQNSSHALILLFLLRRSMPDLRLGTALWPFLVRVLPAAGLVGLLLVAAWPFLSVVGGLLGLIAAGALVTLVYAGLLLALGVSEVRAVVSLVRSRFAV
jgi:putative peptidoglycan lipid II flippase